MAKKKISVVCILDRSGSMNGTETEVIGAFNNFVEEQRKIKSATIDLTLVLFDNIYELVYKNIPINDVKELTSNTYFTRGMTALNDAIGKTITDFDKVKNALFFIETDGAENSSQEFSDKKVKELVEKKKESGWDFIYVGADLSRAQTIDTGVTRGFAMNKTLSIDKSGVGYASRGVAMTAALNTYIQTGDAGSVDQHSTKQ